MTAGPGAGSGRGLRFVGAGLTETPIGLVVTATGAVSTVDGDDAVRQAMMLLLATTPGERLMRPTYGSRLHRLVFAPNDQTTAGLAIHYVRQALRQWEPRVDILDLDAGADPTAASRLIVRLRYRVRASLTIGQLEYPVVLLPSSDSPPGPTPASSPRGTP